MEANIWTVIDHSPYLTVFVILILANMVTVVWNRFWRHLNIRKHGYPPAHCDADGDPIRPKTE